MRKCANTKPTKKLTKQHEKFPSRQRVNEGLHKVGKYVTSDVIFVTVRAQPYWKIVPIRGKYFCIFLYKTKVVKACNHFVSYCSVTL